MNDEYLSFYSFGIKITPFKDDYANVYLYLEDRNDYIDIVLEKEEIKDFYYYLRLVYFDDLNNDNIIKLINDKKIVDSTMYFIVTVVFYEGGKGYKYRCNDESLEEDEYVLVPVNNEVKMAKVIDSNYYSKDEIELDLDKMKWIKSRVDD